MLLSLALLFIVSITSFGTNAISLSSNDVVHATSVEVETLTLGGIEMEQTGAYVELEQDAVLKLSGSISTTMTMEYWYKLSTVPVEPQTHFSLVTESGEVSVSSYRRNSLLLEVNGAGVIVPLRYTLFDVWHHVSISIQPGSAVRLLHDFELVSELNILPRTFQSNCKLYLGGSVSNYAAPVFDPLFSAAISFHKVLIKSEYTTDAAVVKDRAFSDFAVDGTTLAFFDFSMFDSAVFTGEGLLTPTFEVNPSDVATGSPGARAVSTVFTVQRARLSDFLRMAFETNRQIELLKEENTKTVINENSGLSASVQPDDLIQPRRAFNCYGRYAVLDLAAYSYPTTETTLILHYKVTDITTVSSPFGLGGSNDIAPMFISGALRSHFNGVSKDWTSSNFYVNEWVTMVVTWKAGNTYLRVKDIDTTFVLSSGSLEPNTNFKVSVGMEYDTDTPSDYFKGSIAQAYLFDKVLTSEEIADLETQMFYKLPEESGISYMFRGTYKEDWIDYDNLQVQSYPANSTIVASTTPIAMYYPNSLPPEGFATVAPQWPQ